MVTTEFSLFSALCHLIGVGFGIGIGLYWGIGVGKAISDLAEGLSVKIGRYLNSRGEQ